MSEEKDPIFIRLNAMTKAVMENPEATKFNKEFGRKVGFRIPGECVILLDTANLTLKKYAEEEAPETDLELIGKREILTDIIVLGKSPTKYMMLRKFKTKGSFEELMKYGKLQDFVKDSPIIEEALKEAKKLLSS